MRTIVTARTRTQTETYPLVSLTKVWRSNGLPYSGWPKTGVLQSKTELMKDTSTPQFDKLRNQGIVLCKDCQKSETTIFTPLGTYNQQVQSNGVWVPHVSYHCRATDLISNANTIVWPSVPSNVNIDSEAAKVVNHFRAKIDASDVQALVMLAEMKKIPGTFTGIIHSVISLLNECRRKELALSRSSLRNNPRKLALEIARVWLAARFGLRPLYYDAMSVINHLRNTQEKPKRIRYKSTASLPSGITTSTGTAANFEGYFQYTATISRVLEISGGALVQPQWSENTRSRIQSITEIPEALWELVPWSFVVDWFINVGDTIAALTPEFEVAELSSWVTVDENITKSYILTGCSLSKERYAARGSLDGFSYSNTTRVRTRYAYPPASLMPHVKVRINFGRVIDATMLLQQLLNKIMSTRVGGKIVRATW